MRAAIYHEFNGAIAVEDVDDPAVPEDGVVIEIKASGLCRSDLFAWHGNDPDLGLPHVPGHELSGVVGEVGKDVKRWKVGERVTAPFCCGCGTCGFCQAGSQQVCDNYYQPGFTHWGSFAQYCAIPAADVNLAALPEAWSFESASILGCRMITAYRALIQRGRLQAGEWVAIHGCGGLGLSMIAIATAVGARAIAVDLDSGALELATKLGAEVTVQAEAGNGRTAVSQIRDVTGGGVDVAVDAFGNAEVAGNSIKSLRRQGRHVQAGLLKGSTTELPLAMVVSKEIEVIGTKGMSAHHYPAVFELLEQSETDLSLLISRTLKLSELPAAFNDMANFNAIGVAVVNSF